jgi:hypothetical protein
VHPHGPFNVLVAARSASLGASAVMRADFSSAGSSRNFNSAEPEKFSPGDNIDRAAMAPRAS